MQGTEGQEPARNTDLVEGLTEAPSKKKSSPTKSRKQQDKAAAAEAKPVKVVPLAQCFHCDAKVEIVDAQLVKTPAGNNKKEGLRFAGHCSVCDRKVGIFVDSNLEVHPKPKKELTPEQKLKKKERSRKKRAKKAEERKASLRVTLGLGPNDALPKKEKKRKAPEADSLPVAHSLIAKNEDSVAVAPALCESPKTPVKKQRKSKEVVASKQ